MPTLTEATARTIQGRMVDLVDTVTDEVISTGHKLATIGYSYPHHYIDGVGITATVYPAAPDLLFVHGTRFAYAPTGMF